MNADGSKAGRSVPNAVADSAPAASGPEGLEVIVIFTTGHGTRRALEEADRLARDLDARIRLIVPDAVPYQAPLPRGAGRVGVPCGLLTELLSGVRSPVRVELYRCRDRREVFRDMIPPNATILIGTGGFWSKWRERRLAAFLASLGHELIEVNSNGPHHVVRHENALDATEYG